MSIERTGAVSGYKSHKEINFESKQTLSALLADFRYIRILTKLAIAFVMGYLFYKIPQARYDSIKSNKYLYRSFIWFSILWFSLMHINNYNVEMYYLPYLIIACLPQLSAGILFT